MSEQTVERFITASLWDILHKNVAHHVEEQIGVQIETLIWPLFISLEDVFDVG